MLTAQQKKLLDLIAESERKGELTPSFEEMKEAMGLKSKSGIHRLIKALVERGFVEQLPNRARALSVKKLPEKLENGMKQLGAVAESMLTQLPILGKIAAGTPIEALEQRDNFLPFPSDALGHGSHYALQVEGDSMIEAGIMDRDMVIIRETNTAPNGAIVVALVNGQEATLKTLQRRGPTVDLIPANSNYSVQTYPSDAVQVQGVLVSLYRNYH